MKVTFESANLSEAEVLIKGDITSSEVEALLDFVKGFNANTTKKLLLHREDEQFLVDPCEVIYIEASNNKVEAVTASGVYDSKKSFTSLKTSSADFLLLRLTKALW